MTITITIKIGFLVIEAITLLLIFSLYDRGSQAHGSTENGTYSETPSNDKQNRCPSTATR